ncbi:hypothetical protein D3C73_1462710 [compost metagenome]
MPVHRPSGFRFIRIEQSEQHAHIRHLEGIGGMLHFRLMEHVSIGQAVHPLQIEHIFLLLNVGG